MIIKNPSNLIVTNVRIQCRDEHQTLVKHLLDVVDIRDYAYDAIVGECEAGISEQSRRSQGVSAHSEFKDVELKVSVAAGDGNRHIITYYLTTDRGEMFGLRGIHLPGHD